MQPWLWVSGPQRFRSPSWFPAGPSCSHPLRAAPPDQSSRSGALIMPLLFSEASHDPRGLASFPVCYRNHFIQVTVPLAWRSLWSAWGDPGVGVTRSECETCFCHLLVGWHWVTHAAPPDLASSFVHCWYCPSHEFGVGMKWDNMGERSLLTVKCFLRPRCIHICDTHMYKGTRWPCPYKYGSCFPAWHTCKESSRFVFDSEVLMGFWEENGGTAWEYIKRLEGNSKSSDGLKGEVHQEGTGTHTVKSWGRFLWRQPQAGPGAVR